MIPLFKVFMSPDAPAHVSATLKSGYIGEGPRVEEFENALSTYIGADAVTVNSGTSAIWLALDLLGVKENTYVIASPMTCLASNIPALHLGAKVLWADVDRSGVIDPRSVRNLLEKLPWEQRSRVRAILFTSYGGVPPDYGWLREVAGNIPLVEDAAHAFGTEYKGQKTGTFADITCFSFQAIKLLTTGDGGALVMPSSTSLALLWKEAKRKRWFGLDRSKGGFRCEQNVTELGYKFHMNDIAASIGLMNLPHVPTLLEQTRENARFYDEYFIPYIGGLSITEVPVMSNPSWWLYTLLVEKRDEFIGDMAKLGVQCARPHSRNDTNSIFSRSQVDLPGVEYFDSRQVAIPVGWWVNEEDREHIASSVRTAMGRLRDGVS